MKQLRRLVGAIALVMAACSLALVVCEMVARLIGGEPLLAWRLPSVQMRRKQNDLRALISSDAIPSEIDPAWINSSPPPLPNKGPIDPELLRRVQAGRGSDFQPFELIRTWNSRLVEAQACTPGNVFERLPGPLLVFDPPEPDKHPTFRYPLARTLPGGLTTNRFGWRGADIPLDKPSGTIRLAFVGASTTVGLPELPFSYPEYVVQWLNLWAARAGLSVHFDGINAGREGLSSTDIAAVVRQEVLPAEPDLVMYYEGANQSLCANDGVNPKPLSADRTEQTALRRALTVMQEHSTLARRVQELVLRLEARDGLEPSKPRHTMSWWQPELDVGHPYDDQQHLPQAEHVVLASLDSAREALAAQGATLAVSSFVWLVSDGLRLDPLRHLVIYHHLNEWCWPYSYAEVRRAVDLHNRLLEQYADAHQLPFLDVASAFPADPDLFFDCIHLNGDGTRIHAWIVFRELLPLVRARIESGAWPRADQISLQEHPGIKPARAFVSHCAEATPTARAPRQPTATPRSDAPFF